jgi:hypothetical protein
MTVGEIGDPASLCKGKFWAISDLSDGGSESEVDGEESANSCCSFRYVCRSPSPVSGRSMQVSDTTRKPLLQQRFYLYLNVNIGVATTFTNA